MMLNVSEEVIQSVFVVRIASKKLQIYDPLEAQRPDADVLRSVAMQMCCCSFDLHL